MQELLRLVQYSTWANQQVFQACLAAEPALLTENEGGTIGSVEQTLKHTVGVEEVYLAMLRGHKLEEVLEPRETYYQHDLPWFSRRAPELGDGYRALLSERDEAWLESTIRIPWFDFPMTMQDGLLKDLTPCTPHAARLLSVLGAHGLRTPDADYVSLLVEEWKASPQ